MMLYCGTCKKQTRHHWDEYFNKFVCGKASQHNELYKKHSTKIVDFSDIQEYQELEKRGDK